MIMVIISMDDVKLSMVTSTCQGTPKFKGLMVHSFTLVELMVVGPCNILEVEPRIAGLMDTSMVIQCVLNTTTDKN